jgi:Dyp-type peroxidase family
MADLDLDNIQGLIARGYADLKAASYLLLEIVEPMATRSWLDDLASSQVTPAPAHPTSTALNIAFTASGLAKLGLSTETLVQFSNEFTSGMTTPHRRRTLGDVGSSAPEAWLWGGPHTATPDALLLVFGRDEATLVQHMATLSAGFETGGVSEILRLDAFVDLDGKEHFGFADGISQPTIEGLSTRLDTPPNTIKAGEFVLGYANEYGRFTDAPDLAHDGAYLIFRQLRQDVRGFWQFAHEASRDIAGEGDARQRTHLAAKLVGRWPSGAPLTLTPDVDDPRLSTANDFTYHYADALGLSCPIGAHVRRAHPRDALDPDPGTMRSVALDKRHRLLRRGREYGPPVTDVLAPAPPDDPERGLYFICIAANIARQFEFVQHTWLNKPTFSGLYDEQDPLIGEHPIGANFFSVPADPVRVRYANLPRFVTVRGGAYFFLPSLRALRVLAGR